ncbi:hypothetical protein NDU88_001543 [Pleurodeles waltl]|uniref:Uncharacterized protein n=1 Tax=Pleurodeles waltl TaxID=8319 RepID=A0AAV7P7C0_PLEWA|nr:hypothetical protein NDU88_001543 [Pleurodeles waltl]
MNSGGRGTRTIRRTPGLVFDSLERSRSQDSYGPDIVKRIAGPGEHTNEPAMLPDKHGQARYGNSGRGGRSGKKEEKRGKEKHRRTCAVAALNSPETFQGAALSIGSLPDPRDSEAVKGVGPPTQRREGRIPWWITKETERESRNEQWRTRNEDDLEDARTGLRQPGEEPESGFVWTRHREEDRWPRGAYE